MWIRTCIMKCRSLDPSYSASDASSFDPTEFNPATDTEWKKPRSIDVRGLTTIAPNLANIVQGL